MFMKMQVTVILLGRFTATTRRGHTLLMVMMLVVMFNMGLAAFPD
jgi:hypothetical protein